MRCALPEVSRLVGMGPWAALGAGLAAACVVAAVAGDAQDTLVLEDGTTVSGRIRGVVGGAYEVEVGDAEVRRYALSDVEQVVPGRAPKPPPISLREPGTAVGFDLHALGGGLRVTRFLDHPRVDSVGARVGVAFGMYVSSSMSTGGAWGAHASFFATLRAGRRVRLEGSSGPGGALISGEVHPMWTVGAATLVDLDPTVAIRIGTVAGVTPSTSPYGFGTVELGLTTAF